MKAGTGKQIAALNLSSILVHKRDALRWPLIVASALAAMVLGHALELWLENLRLFGDVRADYAHSAQTVILELAGGLFLAVLVALGWRLFHFAARNERPADWLFPALLGIARTSYVRTALSLLSMQFGLLVASELLEQRLSDFNAAGLSPIFGPGHASAVAVHFIVGLIAAFVLFRAAQYICARSRALLGIVGAFFRLVRSRAQTTSATSLRSVNTASTGPKPPLIALGLANRPPPQTSTLTA